MNLYILKSVEKLTTNYHSGGGVVIIAQDLEHAKVVLQEGIKSYEKAEYLWRYEDEDGYYETKFNAKGLGATEEEWAKAEVIPMGLDQTPRVYIFPDKGCC